MLVTQAVPLSSYRSPKATARPPDGPPNSRPALADSTNFASRTDGFNVYPHSSKRVVYPTSSARTGLGCGPNGVEFPLGYILNPYHSRHNPSAFHMTCKAPPTVSVSLSAACSQSGHRSSHSGSQGSEPDLPDVRNVVPFPSTPLDGSQDIEMFDGTCLSSHDSRYPPPSIARKRRSAHSSVSSSQGNLVKKDIKDMSSAGSTRKRARKSRKQVAEIWWLEVLHRSISRAIEARQKSENLSARRDFGAMDQILVERIRRRLTNNGCVEGRPMPCPLPRISPPSVSGLSLNLEAPMWKSPSDAMSNDFEASITFSREASSLEADQLLVSSVPCSTSPPIISHYPTPVVNSTSSRPHVHFENSQRSCEPVAHRSPRPRRSPSPPKRPGSSPTHPQAVTLTMPQIVASLTLAHRERGRSRPRGRSAKGDLDYRNGEPVDHSLPPSQVVRCDAGDVIRDEERMHKSFESCRRLLCTPERKSPLSRIAYTES